MHRPIAGILKQSIHRLIFGFLFLTASQLHINSLQAEEMKNGYKASYTGLPLVGLLEPSATFSCSSDTAATTGYHREIGKAEVSLESSAIKSQPAGAGYKISIEGRYAFVFDQAQERKERFQVTTRSPNGVILIRNRGSKGVSVMTIDPLNGSFVLSDSVVHTLTNRTNVWVGRCTSEPV